MRLLLDTHALLWFDTDPTQLSPKAVSLLRDRKNQIYVSAISAWELAIKNRLGKLPSASPLLNSYHSSLARYGFLALPLSSDHALAERTLSHDHKDPFDRALVAQAVSEKLGLLSSDVKLAQFREVQVVW